VVCSKKCITKFESGVAEKVKTGKYGGSWGEGEDGQAGRQLSRAEVLLV
jgi:hypothetical protein